MALAGFKSFVCLRPDECGLQWHWFWLAISPGLKMPSESKRNPCENVCHRQTRFFFIEQQGRLKINVSGGLEFFTIKSQKHKLRHVRA